MPIHTFLVACTRLYKSLCRSVGRSVGPSVRPSRCAFLCVFQCFNEFWACFWCFCKFSQVFTSFHKFSQVFTSFHKFSQVFTSFHIFHIFCNESTRLMAMALFLCKNTYILTRGYFSRCFISTPAWLIYLSILSSIQTQFFRMNSDQIVGRDISNVLQKILDSKIL